MREHKGTDPRTVDQLARILCHSIVRSTNIDEARSLPFRLYSRYDPYPKITEERDGRDVKNSADRPASVVEATERTLR